MYLVKGVLLLIPYAAAGSNIASEQDLLFWDQQSNPIILLELSESFYFD
jgi:hypothetical protein